MKVLSPGGKDNTSMATVYLIFWWRGQVLNGYLRRDNESCPTRKCLGTPSACLARCLDCEDSKALGGVYIS